MSDCFVGGNDVFFNGMIMHLLSFSYLKKSLREVWINLCIFLHECRRRDRT